MKDSEYLSAARDLIADPENWTQGNWCVVGSDPGQAVQLCAEGAVRWAVNSLHDPNLSIPERAGHDSSCSNRLEALLIETAQEVLPEVRDPSYFNEQDVAPKRLWHYNDAYGEDEQGNSVFVTRHEDIMAIFDKTINSLEEQGK